MTDEELDRYGYMFLHFSVRHYLKITFEQFLVQPDIYIDKAIDKMMTFKGIHATN
jgi:hypothetical protein